MRRTLLALVVALVAASWTAASAATLTVESDKLTYLVGETITLTVFGDDEGVEALFVQGVLLYSGALVDNGTRSQTPLGPGWQVPAGLAEGDDGFNAYSLAFYQHRLFDESDSPNLPGTLSVVTLIAQAIGVVDVSWDTTEPFDQLAFFGLTSAPGTSFSIVPEPGTAVLLGIGLFYLAVRRRARA
jgi:hypothetical protein